MISILFEEVNDEKIKSLIEINEPFLIKNGLKAFDKIIKWNQEYLVNKFQNEKCHYSFDARPVMSRNNDTLKNYFENFKSTAYLFDRKKYSINKHFLDDLYFPNPYFNEKMISNYILYSGSTNTGALPHSHGAAFNCMVYGKKQWILFDSSTMQGKQLERYYYKNYSNGCMWKQWYDKEYEKLLNINITKECIQNSGDIIYIPKYYNHAVLNKEDTLGLVIEIS